MALSLSVLQAKRDELVAALCSPVERLEFEARRLGYRSVEEMKKQLAFIDSEIEKAGGTAKSPKVSYVSVYR